MIDCPFQHEITAAIQLHPEWNMPIPTPSAQAQSPYMDGDTWEDYLPNCAAPDWVIVHITREDDDSQLRAMANIASQGITRGATCVIALTITSSPALKQFREELTRVNPGITVSSKWYNTKHDACFYGAAVEANIKLSLLIPASFQETHLKVIPSHASPMRQHLDPALATCDNNCDWELVQNISPRFDAASNVRTSGASPTTNAGNHRVNPQRPSIVAFLHPGNPAEDSPAEWSAIYDVDHPAPAIEHLRGTSWNGYPMLVATTEPIPQIRGISFTEVMQLLGLSTHKTNILTCSADTVNIQCLADTAPRQALQSIFQAIAAAEEAQPKSMLAWHGVTNGIADEPNEDGTAAMFSPLNTPSSQQPTAFLLKTPLGWTLPDEDTWKAASRRDPDIRKAIAILKGDEPKTNHGWTAAQYATELRYDRLDFEGDMLYHYELSHKKYHRQLRTRVVPVTLRDAVISACHASPMSGHLDAHKTVWKALARFWWPNITRDIFRAVKSCAHCRVSNLTSHQAQLELKSVMSQRPFDIMHFDLWQPGNMPVSFGGKIHRYVLTGTCHMTGFALAIPISQKASDDIALALFTHFIAVFGLPNLIIVDAGSEFAGDVTAVVKLIQIRYYAVTRENHQALMVERFHRYMNKVQRLHAADCETPEDWIIGISFAVYAWNAAPIEGTDIPRSYAAIGREFALPIDTHLSTDQLPRADNFGELSTAHIEAGFPLLFKQQQLLKILTEERRAYHRALRNKNKTNPTFNVGDLVIVRKQSPTTEAHGPGKLRFEARGPFRILEALSSNTYRIQRIPFGSDRGTRPGAPYKETAARMEKLPSTLVIHRPIEGADANWAAYRHAISPSPLDRTLGITDYGKYQQAPVNSKYAFEPIDELWRDIVETPEEEGDTAPMAPDEGDTPPVAPDGNPNTATPDTDADHGATSRDTSSPSLKRTLPQPARLTRSKTAKVAKKVSFANPASAPPDQPKTYGRLVDAIRRSSDRLFFIRYQPSSSSPTPWRLIQVIDNDATLRSCRKTGLFRVRFWIRHNIDCTSKPLRACRYWPEIHHTVNNISALSPVSPNKTPHFLQRNRRTHKATDVSLNLPQCSLWGPFSFHRDKAGHNTHTIAAKHWDRLLTLTTQHNLNPALDDILPWPFK